MKALVLSPVLLSKMSEHLGRGLASSGGWVESLLAQMHAIAGDLETCVLVVDAHGDDFMDGPTRYVTTPLSEYGQTLQSLIADFRPDVIHINGTEFFYGAFPLETYGGVPVVVSLQGVINGCHMHYAGGLAPAELKGTNFNLRYVLRRTGILEEQRFWRTTRSKTEEITLSQHRYFIGRTQWDEDWVRFFNPKAVYYHVNETLRSPFYQAQREGEKIVRHAIFCGGAAGYPLKGAHWLIRAIAALKCDYPDIQLRIAASEWKIGLHRSFDARLRDEAYSVYLRRLIRTLGVQGNLVALPVLSAEAIANELCMAELFVLPSLCENSPNSLGEAMLVGTPSIATYVGGVPSILKDGIEGRLVPSSDPAALAGAIRRWFENPCEAEACAQNARVTAMKRHDGRINAAEMLRVLNEVANA